MPIIVENGRLKLGVDPDRGGAVCWLGRGGSPDNLLNVYDCGRYIQQSYYGADDGSDWNGARAGGGGEEGFGEAEAAGGGREEWRPCLASPACLPAMPCSPCPTTPRPQ
jgi:hypothetical protein